MSEQVAPVEQKRKPVSPEQYMKNLEKYHRVRKLEAEIAEFDFKEAIARTQLNNLRLQQEAANKEADSDEPTPADDSETQVTGDKD